MKKKSLLSAFLLPFVMEEGRVSSCRRTDIRERRRTLKKKGHGEKKREIHVEKEKDPGSKSFLQEAERNYISRHPLKRGERRGRETTALRREERYVLGGIGKKESSTSLKKREKILASSFLKGEGGELWQGKGSRPASLRGGFVLLRRKFPFFCRCGKGGPTRREGRGTFRCSRREEKALASW